MPRVWNTSLRVVVFATAVVARGLVAQATADTLGFPPPDRPTSRIVAPRWTREDQRDQMGEAAEVMERARIRPGMTVADIGAGDGYYVLRMASAVGPSGKVYAEDITPVYMTLLQRRLDSAAFTNVETVLGTPDDPKLPPRSVDVALLIHMYHEITRPFELLWNLSGAMKPGGTVAILDQDGPTDRHGTPPAVLRCELAAIGYSLIRRDTMRDGAYLALFRAPPAPVQPARVRQQLAADRCAR